MGDGDWTSKKHLPQQCHGHGARLSMVNPCSSCLNCLTAWCGVDQTRRIQSLVRQVVHMRTAHRDCSDAHQRRRPGARRQPQPQRLQHCSGGSRKSVGYVSWTARRQCCVAERGVPPCSGCSMQGAQVPGQHAVKWHSCHRAPMLYISRRAPPSGPSRCRLRRFACMRTL